MVARVKAVLRRFTHEKTTSAAGELPKECVTLVTIINIYEMKNFFLSENFIYQPRFP